MRKSESSIWPMRCKCQFSTPSPFAITLQLNLGQQAAAREESSGANTLDQVPNIFFGVALLTPLEYEKSAHMLSKIVSKPYDIEKQQRFYGVVMKGNSVFSASEDYWHYGFMGAF